MSNICQYFSPKTSNKLKSKTIDSKVSENGFHLNRKQILMKLFNEMNKQLINVKNSLFSPLMQSLFTFVSNNSFTNNMRENCFETKFQSNIGLISTALLSIGMNANHKDVCDLLVESIQDLTSFVVYLNSSQCQTIGCVFDAIRDTILSEELIESAHLNQNSIKRMNFGSLLKTYEEYVINKNINNFCPPIVLFLDKIESFDDSVVTSLVLIIKEYIQTIPFIIIMTKSNETISLQHLLPSSATDFLLIHHFQSVSGHEVSNEVMNRLLIESSLPLRLGPNVLEFMLNMFKKFDFSLQSIDFVIKYAFFQHFFTNELSFLCQTKSDLKSYLKNNDLNVRKVLKNSKLFKSLLKDKELNKLIVNEMKNFMSIHKQFVNNLKILLKLCQQLNENLDLLQLYISALNLNFDFKPVIDLLNKLSQNQWKTALEDCLTDSSLNSDSQELVNVLKCSQKELTETLDQMKNEPQVCIERIDRVLDLKNKLSNLKTRHQWKETMSPLNRPKVLSKFEIWRKTTVTSIEEVLKQTTHPMSSDLRKVVFFDDLDSIKEHIFVNQRNEIQKSLSNPLIISELTETLDSNQLNSDLHKLFVLYNESHSMINMNDMFTEFKELLNQESDPLSGSPKRSKTDKNDENIVRFLSSVSDFEYIGLIQTSVRKSDHLNRLVWF